MLYLLDTNICQMAIANHQPFLAHLDSLDLEIDSVATTIISFDEAVSGWLPLCHNGKQLAKRVWAYEQLTNVFTYYCRQTVFPFTAEAARELVKLRSLFPRGGLADLSIAAIALTLQATVVTQNTVDFMRIPNLPIEDWSV